MSRHERKHRHRDATDESSEHPEPSDDARKGPVIRPERLHPEHLAASLEDVEKLFAPDDPPQEHYYGAQPPG